MKKIIIGLLALTSTSSFASSSYQCSWSMSGKTASMSLVLSEETHTASIASLKDPQQQYPCKMTTVTSAYSFACAVPLVNNNSLMLISIDRTNGSAVVDATTLVNGNLTLYTDFPAIATCTKF